MHLAGVTHEAIMKRQGEIRISLRSTFIHQMTPIEEISNDNGKFAAVPNSVAAALGKDTCCILLNH